MLREPLDADGVLLELLDAGMEDRCSGDQLAETVQVIANGRRIGDVGRGAPTTPASCAAELFPSIELAAEIEALNILRHRLEKIHEFQEP